MIDVKIISLGNFRIKHILVSFVKHYQPFNREMTNSIVELVDNSMEDASYPSQVNSSIYLTTVRRVCYRIF